MLTRRLRRMICKVRGHRWRQHNVAVAGVLTIVPRCERCACVDIERIQQSPWNRRARRKRAKKLGMR